MKAAGGRQEGQQPLRWDRGGQSGRKRLPRPPLPPPPPHTPSALRFTWGTGGWHRHGESRAGHTQGPGLTLGPRRGDHQAEERGGALPLGRGGVCRSPQLHLQIRRQVQQVGAGLSGPGGGRGGVLQSPRHRIRGYGDGRSVLPQLQIERLKEPRPWIPRGLPPAPRLGQQPSLPLGTCPSRPPPCPKGPPSA